MRENRPYGSEGGARFKPLLLPLSFGGSEKADWGQVLTRSVSPPDRSHRLRP
jgi:hypothetical protein